MTRPPRLAIDGSGAFERLAIVGVPRRDGERRDVTRLREADGHRRKRLLEERRLLTEPSRVAVYRARPGLLLVFAQETQTLFFIVRRRGHGRLLRVRLVVVRPSEHI